MKYLRMMKLISVDSLVISGRIKCCNHKVTVLKVKSKIKSEVP